MNKSYPFSEIQGKLASSQKILVVLPAKPKYDQMAGALALSLSLQQAGKSSTVLCPTPTTVEFHNLVGVDKVSPKISGTDLVVSLSYLMDDVEKISYNDDNGKLNLVIQPKAGAPALDEKAASFSFAGVGADLIFAIGIKNLNQLGAIGLGSANPETLVNIDNQPDNTNFAAINIIDIDSSCVSEIIFGLLNGLGSPVDLDIAQNILNGIWQATQGLKKMEAGPDAYETVAGCLRLGAQKQADASPSVSQEDNSPKQKVFQDREIRRTQPQENPQSQPQPQKPQTPPSDWFEPKIYRGSGNV